MTTTVVAVPQLVERLRTVPLLSDLPQSGLEWLAAHMNLVTFEEGEVIIREGDVADRMSVILVGGMRGQVESQPDTGRRYEAYAPQITGLLPYSRLTHYPLTARSIGHSEVATLDSRHFPEMLQTVPDIAGRLVSVLADRVRETTRAEQQQDKLVALGKLSAGLAHELNNPAGAAQRAAGALRESVLALRTANLKLDKYDLTKEQRLHLAHLECDWEKAHPPQALDSLERSDREEEIALALEKRKVPEPWSIAAALVDASATAADIDHLAESVPNELLGPVLTRLTASFAIGRLSAEIEHSTGRITELVRAIKEYSYMDQAPEQEIDVHTGLESTLLMLRHRLKSGVEVVRDYDRSVPRISAYGSELNQVWTNLIENALDAMDGKGVLRVRTSKDFNSVVVEIEDNGPGIAPEIRDRIFDPFFTTKPFGQGTGLGLDAVYRIVRKHRGEVKVESKPGETRFQVRLPFATAPKEEAHGKV